MFIPINTSTQSRPKSLLFSKTSSESDRNRQGKRGIDAQNIQSSAQQVGVYDAMLFPQTPAMQFSTKGK
jgi:hypothetical protein